MVIPFEWERINDRGLGYTERAKVFGGWIVRNFEYGDSATVSLVFIPDGGHQWEIV